MQNVNLSQVNQKYILNKQDNASNPIEAKQNTQQIKDGNNKTKKALAGLAVVGIVIAAGITIYKGRANKVIQETTQATNEVKTKLLKDIKFDKGFATLPDGAKFTGTIEDTLKNGDKITLEYTDGILQKSQRNGSKTFEKMYETRFNGDKLVVINENNTTTRINLTEISNDAKKAQDDFKKILQDDNTSLWELKNCDRTYLNNDQKIQLDKLFEKKSDELKKAEELAKKQAQEAQERAAKQAQERAKKKVQEATHKKDRYSCCSIKKPKYRQKLSSTCSIATENTEDFNKTRETLEEFRNYKLQHIKEKSKFFDEAELKFIDEYSRKNLDDIDVIFDGNYGSPTDKLFLLAKNNLQTRGTSLVVHEIPEIFDGLEPRLIEEAINELSHNLYCNAIKIGDKKFGVEQIGRGTYNAVLRIFDDSGKSVALRVVSSADKVRVACEEIVDAINLTKNNIADVPKFYMGNPFFKRTYIDSTTSYDAGCWQLCEYVTNETPIRKGKKLFDYLKEINGRHQDLNSGAFVGDYIVDFGGINGENMGYNSKLNMGGMLNYIVQNPELELDEILQIINKK